MPSPSSTSSSRAFLFFLSVFIKLAGHQLRQRVHSLSGLRPARPDIDVAARPRRQHHASHDGAAGHTRVALPPGDLRIASFRSLHQLGSGAPAQPLRSEAHTSDTHSLIRTPYAVSCSKKK